MLNNGTPKYKIKVLVACEEHLIYGEKVCQMIDKSAQNPDSGIARRKTSYIKEKIRAGNAVIAISDSWDVVGFCYIESWKGDKNFVANSGLIVASDFRGKGLAKRIKEKVFNITRVKFPDAVMFGITTSPAVMRINYSLGYRPVTFDHLTDDVAFWDGCKTCVNYDILLRTNRKDCLCTAMLFDPNELIKIKDKEMIGNEKESSISL